MDDDRRREVVDATLDALRHVVGRDEHMPHLHAIVAGRVGPVTFAEIAEALASVDVSGRDPEWRAELAELIETIRRAADGGSSSVLSDGRTPELLDHLVGLRLQRERNLDAKPLCCLQVDDQLIARGLQDRQIGYGVTAKKPSHV